jgi:hypothetical protein
MMLLPQSQKKKKKKKMEQATSASRYNMPVTKIIRPYLGWHILFFEQARPQMLAQIAWD